MKRVGAILALMLIIATISLGFQFQIKVDVDLVNINFSPLDKNGRIVPGLTADDFIVEEDGKRQQVALFSRERELPLTLGLLVDMSPSVKPVFEEEKQTAARFLKAVIGPRDLAMVITFDRHVTLAQDFTEDARTLTRSIDDLELVRDGTSLFDAIYLASHDKLARETGRKAVVILSDGEDTTSKYDMGKALIAAQRSDAVIYAISNSGNSKTLRKMAEETGGAFFRFNRKGDYEKNFNEIAEELRSQYFIAFHSNNPAKDGTYRTIKIIPKNASLMVRARKGYYAPTEASGR